MFFKSLLQHQVVWYHADLGLNSLEQARHTFKPTKKLANYTVSKYALQLKGYLLPGGYSKYTRWGGGGKSPIYFFGLKI